MYGVNIFIMCYAMLYYYGIYVNEPTLTVFSIFHKVDVIYKLTYSSEVVLPLLAEPGFTKCDMSLDQHLCWPWNNIVIN